MIVSLRLRLFVLSSPLLLLTLVACAAVRDFLVPPLDSVRVEAQKNTRHQISLVISGVHLPGQPSSTTAVALHGPEIVEVGAMEKMKTRSGAFTVVERLDGAQIWPGVIDAQVDLRSAALFHEAVDLSQIVALSELGELLRNRGTELSEGDWLWAYGLSPQLAAQLGSDVLEVLAPGLPVWLTLEGGQGAVLSRALLARLSPVLAQVYLKRGAVARGHLLRHLWQALPSFSPSRLMPLVVQTLTDLRDRGIVEVHAMDVQASLYRALKRLDRDQRLELRAQIYLRAQSELAQAELVRLAEARRPKLRGKIGDATPVVQSRLARLAGVSLHLDGSFADHEAALLEPYLDRPSSRGSLLHTDAQLASLLTKVDAAGLQLAVFAHGDGAVAQLLRVLGAAAHRPPDARPVRLHGAELIAASQRAELERLSIVVVRLPLVAAAGRDALAQVLGADRSALVLQPWRLSLGVPLLSGSNMPWQQGDPWLRYVAMTRGLGGGAAWGRRLLGSMRTGAMGRQASLRVGALADLAVWSQDPFAQRRPPPLRLLVIDGVMVLRSRLDRLVVGGAPLPALSLL